MKTIFTVHAVAQNQKGEYLILRRAPNRSNPGTWNVITGHIKERESAEDSALRELKEETGLEGKIIKTTEPYFCDVGETRWVMVTSLINIKNIETIKIDSYESDNYKWVKINDPLIQQYPILKDNFIKLKLI